MNVYTLAAILAVLLLAPPLRLAWIGRRDSYGARHRLDPNDRVRAHHNEIGSYYVRGAER